MNSKHCPHCHFNTKIVKIGVTSSNRQRYKCQNCNKTWTSKSHPQLLSKKIWNDLIFHNMNMKELSRKYTMSERTIRRKLDLYHPPEIISEPAEVIAMDVTYFGRTWGLLTVINAHNGKVLYCEPVDGSETVNDYEKAIIYLHRYKIHPKAAIVDGKKGVIHMLEEYGMKVQFCQFHQLRIITQCLTRKPDLKPNIYLRRISLTITKLDEGTFRQLVSKWRLKYGVWVLERTYYENGKWEYTHKKTKRAITSLIDNLPYLFTFQKYPNLNIPNTNNKIEGLHSELKRRLNNHRGLKKQQKIQFARIFFSGRTEV